MKLKLNLKSAVSVILLLSVIFTVFMFSVSCGSNDNENSAKIGGRNESGTEQINTGESAESNDNADNNSKDDTDKTDTVYEGEHGLRDYSVALRKRTEIIRR